MALERFSNDDWEAVTIAQLARTVGIAKGTVYLHFNSKHEIYATLALNFYQSLNDALAAPCRGTSTAHFRQLIHRAFSYYRQMPCYRRVVQYCQRADFRSHLSADLQQQFDKQEQHINRIFCQVVDRGIDDGSFNIVADDALRIGLQCTFHGALNRIWNCPQSSPQQYIDSVTEFMLLTLRNNRSAHTGRPAATRRLPPLETQP